MDNALRWPEDRIRAAEVRSWIESQLVDCTGVDGPTAVLRPTDRGVTARFSVQLGPEKADDASSLNHSVVCKIGFAPRDTASPVTYHILQACAPGHVPELLASQVRGGETWLLFALFQGQVIREMGALAPVVEMGRIMARIQREAALIPPAETRGIERLSVEQLPALLEGVLQRVRQDGLCSGDGRIPIVYERLEVLVNGVARGTRELADGRWPDSLDHPDLHTNNAVLLKDGNVLIYDWEGTTLGCPFFSLDNLLENAGRLDNRPDSRISARPQRGLGYSPSQLAVRNAYLEELPWGTRAARERAFDLAMCLSQVQRAHQQLMFFESLGRDRLAVPGGSMDKHSKVAECLEEAVRRWTAME